MVGLCFAFPSIKSMGFLFSVFFFESAFVLNNVSFLHSPDRALSLSVRSGRSRCSEHQRSSVFRTETSTELASSLPFLPPSSFSCRRGGKASFWVATSRRGESGPHRVAARADGGGVEFFGATGVGAGSTDYLGGARGRQWAARLLVLLGLRRRPGLRTHTRRNIYGEVGSFAAGAGSRSSLLQ